MGFDSFLGNTKAVEAVRAMAAGSRVPGALLFTGPDGVGKKTLALMLAIAMNCERLSAQGDFCGTCARCRKADEMLAATREDLARRRETKDAQRRADGLVYFDLQLIEPITRFILIEQIRQLRHVAYSRPFEFPHRVFIIDEAQAIHWQAIDLLLKVLEEPPETTTLILVCPNAYELRPTIRSRRRAVWRKRKPLTPPSSSGGDAPGWHSWMPWRALTTRRTPPTGGRCSIPLKLWRKTATPSRKHSAPGTVCFVIWWAHSRADRKRRW
ncbi:MAG: hypothetical protein LAO07_17815 [Acidobacteriia bacterium]|nr:hypothetical protein [Terriglobia bacterium]